MTENVISKINTLMNMAGPINTIESLEDELAGIIEQLKDLNQKADDLKKSMVNSKYIKASDRIIDENIKIGLENKIAKYQDQLSLCLNQITEVSNQEEEYHQIVENLENELQSLRSFLSALELKSKTIGSKDQTSYNLYQNLMDNVSNEIEEVEKKLREQKGTYEQIKKRLESYGIRRSQVEKLLTTTQDKLKETDAYLANPENYVDYKEKQDDEKQLESLKTKIEQLERRKLEILTDPVYIGEDAKKLVEAKDYDKALEKVKELVTIVETKPYMNYQYNELADLLEEAKAKRDEFASQIEGKEYLARNNNIANTRREYLKQRLTKLTSIKEQLVSQIKRIDTEEVQELMNSVTELHHLKEQLQADINSYRTVLLEDEEYQTPRKKANLKAAFDEKCSELQFITDLWQKYEQEMATTVSKSKDLEENDLNAISNEIDSIKKEITSLEKRNTKKDVPLDILAMEKDKNELKQLSDEVEKITNRQQYKKMPNEIYDEIEVALKATVEKKQDIPDKKEDFVNLNDYRIENINDDFFDKKEEPDTSEQPVVPEIPSIPNIEEQDEMVFPPRNTTLKPVEDSTPSLKVVNVEPIETKEVEELKDDSFMVNDLEDTNYISFNDLLEDNDGN